MKKFLLFFIVLFAFLATNVRADCFIVTFPITVDSITVYPVPNDGQFDIIIMPATEEIFSIIIYNIMGKKIYEKELRARDGTISVNIHPIKSGLYNLILKKESWIKTKRIIIK